MSGAGPSCEVADVGSRRVRVDGGQGFFLSNTSHSHPSTRHFPHGAWSFSEWPHVHIPSLLSLMPSAQHLITALGAWGNHERRMFF